MTSAEQIKALLHLAGTRLGLWPESSDAVERTWGRGVQTGLLIGASLGFWIGALACALVLTLAGLVSAA